MSSIIRRFPFVRAIFISGELSKGVASQTGDVDFVIVTAKNRLWICRTLLILFKKIALLNSKKYFCLNHFVAERNLVVHEQNLYTAVELGTLKPLYNHNLFDSYLSANPWLSTYLPNLTPTIRESDPPERSFLQRAVESIFVEPFASRLEAFLLRFWQTVWKRRYAHLSRRKREQLFRSTPDLSTAYNGDFAETILTKYQERLRQFGLYG